MGLSILPLGVALILLLTACGQQTPSSFVDDTALAAAISALPAVGELDGLPGGAVGARQSPGRGSSVVQQQDADVTLPLASAFGLASAGKWTFQGQAGDHSWALYSLPAPAPTATLQSLRAQGTTQLWMLLANYQTGRWMPLKMVAGPTAFDLTAPGQWTSPGGNIYCAFILPAGVAGSPQLSSITLTYDDNIIPQGPQFYVAPPASGGNDANDGSQANPWATLQHAADTVVAGDTVNVLPGNYTAFMLQTSGLPGQPIRFLAQPGANITDVNPINDTDGINLENWGAGSAISYVVVDGFTVDGDNCVNRPRTGIRIVGGGGADHAHHITISNNTCLNCGEWGILTGFASDITIENNECAYSIGQHGIYHSNSGDRATIRGNRLHHNNDCGLHMNGDVSLGGDGILSDCLVENNIVYENGAGGGSCINCDGVQDSIIRNNLIYGAHASGISLYQIDAGAGATNNYVLNNTVVVAANGRWAMNIMAGSTGTSLRNNIFLNLHNFRGSITLTPDCLTGFSSDYNVVMDRLTADDGNSVLTLAQWQGSTGQDANSLVATPAQLFALPNGPNPPDYLLSAASPARNAGTGIGSNLPTADLLGTLRPQGAAYDIGCYEMP